MTSLAAWAAVDARAISSFYLVSDSRITFDDGRPPFDRAQKLFASSRYADPRPFSFLLLPQVDSSGGHPADVDNSRFTLVTSFTSKRNEWLKSECINIFDGKIYQLALEQTAQLDKVIPRTYAHVLYLYTKHPEAKSLAPDGTPCTCDTRGLLQGSSVTAASRRYVGKETDRRWEQGEDLSLVEFTSFEYQQSKQVVAGEEIKNDILKFGIRKLERDTGVSHHTLDKITKGAPVRRKTLVKVMHRLSRAV
jgi:hypothetical protein